MRLYVDEKKNTYEFKLMDFDGNDISEEVITRIVNFGENTDYYSYLNEEEMKVLDTDTHFAVASKEVYNFLVRVVREYQSMINDIINIYLSGGGSAQEKEHYREKARIR